MEAETSQPSSTKVTMTLPVAPIIGGGIGGFLLIVGLLALVIFCKRKQFRPKLLKLSLSSSTKGSNETEDTTQYDGDDDDMVSKSKLHYSQSMIVLPTRSRYSENNSDSETHLGTAGNRVHSDRVRVSPKHRYHRHNSEISDSDSLPIVTDLHNNAARHTIQEVVPCVSFKLPHVPSQLNMTRIVDDYYSNQQQSKARQKVDAYPDILQESLRNDLHRVDKSEAKTKNSPLSKLRKSKSMRSSYKYQGIDVESQPHPLREIEQIIDNRLGVGARRGETDHQQPDELDHRRISQISPIHQHKKSERQYGGTANLRPGAIDDTSFGERLDTGYGKLVDTKYDGIVNSAISSTTAADEVVDLVLGETSELRLPTMFYPYPESGVFHNPLYETMNRDNLNANSFTFNSIVYSKRIRPMIIAHNEPAIDYRDTFTSEDGLRYAQNQARTHGDTHLAFGEHRLGDQDRLVRMPLYSINRSGEWDSSLRQEPSQLPNSDDYYYLHNIIPKVYTQNPHWSQDSGRESRTPPTPLPKPRSRTTSLSSTNPSLTYSLPEKTFSSSFAPQQIYFAPRSPVMPDKHYPASILRKQVTPTRTVSENRGQFDMEHFVHKRTQSEEQHRLDSYAHHDNMYPPFSSAIYWPSNTSTA